MPPETNHKKYAFITLGAFLFTSSSFALMQTETHTSFRTPVKRQGGAYTVKLSIKRNIYEYTVPVWVRPDMAQSTLDRTMLKDLGWIYPDLEADEFKLSNEEIGHPHFKNAKSDWVTLPDFPKTCCYGVLGQDLLRNYEILFDPQDPSHLEWKVVVDQSQSPIPASFSRSLASLFSLRSEVIKVDGKKVDLSEVPYRVNLSQRRLEWESPDATRLAKRKLKIRENPIFSFSFTVPDRDVEIQRLSPELVKSAKVFGIHSGVRVLEFNWIPINLWDKYEIQSLLLGKKMNLLPMKLEFRAKTMTQEAIRKEVNFDFVKNEFVPK